MASLLQRIKEKPDAADARRIAELEKQLAGERIKRQRAEQENKQLTSVIDHQSEVIGHRAKQLFKSPKAATHKGKYFHRVLIPDTHGAHIDPRAASAFLADLEYLQPREVVWLGDHLDCGGFLAQHHTLGFVAEAGFSFVDDITAANEFADAVQKRTPKAEHHWITGNHEHRIEKWCLTSSLRHQKDARYLLEKLGVRASLHLDARGIHYYPRDYVAPDLRVRGAIKLGSCYFVHDVSTARNAAQVALNKWGTNVCFGDTHRIDMAVGRKAERDIIAATNGCLSTLRPFWQETNITDWSHAYGLQLATDAGDFLHIIVPILDGKSLLGPLLGAVK
jgi:hypothetical protein